MGEGMGRHDKVLGEKGVWAGTVMWGGGGVGGVGGERCGCGEEGRLGGVFATSAIV